MNSNKFPLIALCAVSALSTKAIAVNAPVISGDEAYSIGYSYGQGLNAQIVNQENKASVVFDRSLVLKGFSDALESRQSHLTSEQRIQVLTELDEKIKSLIISSQEEVGKRNSRTGQEAAKQAVANGAKLLPIGVVMSTLTQSTKTIPSSTDMVELDYTLSTLDGDVLDTTSGRKPQNFVVSGLMPGVLDAVLLSNEGGKYSLLLPPDVGFGKVSSQVAPGSYLKFEYELISVRKPFGETLLTPELTLK